MKNRKRIAPTSSNQLNADQIFIKNWLVDENVKNCIECFTYISDIVNHEFRLSDWDQEILNHLNKLSDLELIEVLNSMYGGRSN